MSNSKSLMLALALSLFACSDSSPTMLIVVDDPANLAPTQLRMTIKVEGADALSITRPEPASQPLPSGQSLRVLLPEAALDTSVSVVVEGLLDGESQGSASGTFQPIAGEELVARLSLTPKADVTCSPESCPDGCCLDGVCRLAQLDSCGQGGASCEPCDPKRADTCEAGACRCGAGDPCTGDTACIDGACAPVVSTGCTVDADCQGSAVRDGCYASVCQDGVCASAPKISGTACGSDSACTTHACDGAGSCVPNHLPSTVSCGAETACTTFACNGAGACAPIHKPSSTTCGPSDACGSSSCDGAGTCVRTLSPVGTSCGQNNTCVSSKCTSAGTCEVLYQPANADCGSEECVSRTCDGSGACLELNRTGFCDSEPCGSCSDGYCMTRCAGGQQCCGGACRSVTYVCSIEP